MFIFFLIRKEYARFENFGIPAKRHLIPGYFVAAIVKQYQWHRAQIISKFSADSFKVRLVDYGDVEYIHLDNIRYIRKHYIEIFPIKQYDVGFDRKAIIGRKQSQFNSEPKSLTKIW
jgi:hypothetical protein